MSRRPGAVDAVMTVDPRSCMDLDDGFWVEPLKGGGYRLKIVVANVAAVVAPGSEVSKVAESLAFTKYREGRADWHMLPKHLAISGCSLIEQEVRPAVVFEVRLSARCEIVRWKIRLGRVRNVHQLSYAEADELADCNGRNSDMVRLAIAIGLHLERQRLGLAVEATDWSGYPTKTQYRRIVSQLTHHDHASHVAVAEFNILMNRLAARWMQRRGIPAPYRTFKGDRGRKSRRGMSRRVRDRLPRPLAQYSARPAPHRGLRVDEYTPASRPIRDYVSLVVQQQLVAALQGEALPYSADQLEVIGARQRRAEREHRAQMRHNERLALRRAREANGLVASVAN